LHPNDNAYSESLFHTLKYRPEYPERPFSNLEAARDWVSTFAAWYNHEHLHSGIKFVSPADRHAGKDEAILAKRKNVYLLAKSRNPQRWTGDIKKNGVRSFRTTHKKTFFPIVLFHQILM